MTDAFRVFAASGQLGYGFTEAALERVRASDVLDVRRIADLYGVPPETVRVIPYPPARAIKVTIPRAVPSGDPDDADVYGAQQHVPLASLVVPGA